MISNADEQSLLGSDHVGAGHSDAGPSRRQVLAGAGGVGLLGLTQAKVFTMPNRPVPTGTPNVYARAAADAREDAIWSARRDTSTGYGIAVFDVDPGEDRDDGLTSITVRYFHALGADPVNPATGAKGAPTPNYTEFESFILVRPRTDRNHEKRWQAARR